MIEGERMGKDARTAGAAANTNGRSRHVRTPADPATEAFTRRVAVIPRPRPRGAGGDAAPPPAAPTTRIPLARARPPQSAQTDGATTRVPRVPPGPARNDRAAPVDNRKGRGLIVAPGPRSGALPFDGTTTWVPVVPPRVTRRPDGAGRPPVDAVTERIPVAAPPAEDVTERMAVVPAPDPEPVTTQVPHVLPPSRRGRPVGPRRTPAPATTRPAPVPASVYLGGSAAPRRTLRDILEATARAHPRAAAIDDGLQVLDYTALLRAVDVLGATLSASGIGLGDRIGIRVPSGTADLYIAVLATLSIGAAYVPVDADDPDDRADMVFGEAGVCAVIGAKRAVTLRQTPPKRVGPRLPGPADDAWIIFTSGSTGKPKGVAVTHGSAAAFVDAEARLFLQGKPLGPHDRVLAGLSVAFDASCEEMWLAWRHGACLVPAPRSLVRSGADLGDWLVEQRISVVSTVPTLAALWPSEQLRGIRLLILGGEACPEKLAHRLAEACAEVWNTYGPTETTVVACAAQMRADEPVRIGLPLDGWQLAVVDPETGVPVESGGIGELVIAGVGTARYLDAEKDAAKFRPLPSLGWERAYRSGDLVRADPEGISFIGRADTQVKIRGFRIELSEIEAVLLQMPGVGQAVVTTYESAPGLTEIVAYYSPVPGSAVDAEGIRTTLRNRLPGHMVPGYVEHLAEIPMMTSGKADRKALPPPKRRSGGASPEAYVAPANRAETVLADALAEIVGLDKVSVESHFFDDLGANSLMLAHFSAKVRQTGGVPPVAMQDIYQNPTVRSLAAVLPEGDAPATVSVPEPAAVRRVGTLSYVFCGLMQLLVMVGLIALGAALFDIGLRWIWPATDPVQIFLRTSAFSTASLAGFVLLPVLAKWLLIGRWKPQEIRLWSLGYLRFWVVKTLIRANPMAMFAGSPLYLMYLRALGAKIGKGVTIFSTTVPVCTDMLRIGAHTVIRGGASFSGYHADGGVIRTGAVSIGADAVVAEGAVLTSGTSMGDGAQLGHASSLHPGQSIPAGEHWHGSPARPTDVDFSGVEPRRCGSVRRFLYSLLQLFNLLVLAPVVATAALWVLQKISYVSDIVGPGPIAAVRGGFYLEQLALAAVVLFGGFVVGLLYVATVPRLVHRYLPSEEAYRLYGIRYWVLRFVARTTNLNFFVNFFGDSSYIVGYLRWVGYRIPRTGQTGSNFGATLTHVTPYLCVIGEDTMVSDGVALTTASFSSTSFKTGKAEIGAHSFLGNAITYPVGGKVGENCLVGTKTMIPIEGELRHDVGLLGSPAFEIPRSLNTEGRKDLSRKQFRRRLTGKNRHNIATMTIYLLLAWVRTYVTFLLGFTAVDLYDPYGVAALAGGTVAAAVFNFFWSVVVERAATGFRRLQPQFCSIYEPYFWWHERYWKLSTQPAVFNGTPFKAMAWRLLGVQVGRRLFDDGSGMSEKTLVRIGDDCTINAGVNMQAHSMEDGVFKADHIEVGSGVTLGTSSFVHYGVTIGDDAVLAPDSFVMKGTEVPARARWQGNPAREISVADQVRVSMPV
jgi:non-ribosomal peptide synthetase-like protein